MKFIDEISIQITSGNGGAGCSSFLREKYRARGGPDGGNGGKGGDVIMKANPRLNSLIDFRRGRNYLAQNGRPGQNRQKDGANGENVVLEVPVGTVVKTAEDKVLADFTQTQECVLLCGGRGGKGNAFFKNSVNQAPDHSQPGEPGETSPLFLELKLIADVGIVGLPNAGKSTLISVMSAAKPKVADYPFTTLVPNLGVVKLEQGVSFVVADIPGLIKGAHKGVGLGHKFLRHIQRTRLLIHLIDVCGSDGDDPFCAFEQINEELKLYDEQKKAEKDFVPLSKRVQIVVLNKIDVLKKEELDFIVGKFIQSKNITPLTLSAVTGKGVKPLIGKIARFFFDEDEFDEHDGQNEHK